MTSGQLLLPTHPSNDGQTDGMMKATSVANQVLHNNDMADFLASENCVTHWDGFYIFNYKYIDQPEIRFGGGALLVVRTRDYLGGMVHVPPNWVEECLGTLYAPITTVFNLFDDEQVNDP